jgi:hypothetical protein
MNAQELRIGNWVRLGKSNRWSDKYSGEYVQVTADCFGTSECGAIWIDDYSPTPLTPEILEMAGFERNESPMGTWSGGDHMIHEHDNGEFTFMPFCAYCPIRIEYVHQLQNLIFALTGTELNIKL